MSEQPAPYHAGQPARLEAFKQKPCSLPFSDPGYIPPTPEEVDALIKLAGLSQRQTAQITGVRYDDKGSSAVRKWRASTDKTYHRAISYAAWRLLLLEAGVVEFKVTFG